MESASANGYQKQLVEALQYFKCYKDSDVQDFINRKAIEFEKRGWATTYLLLSREKFERGELFIEGYFSLTQKALTYDNDVSRSKRQRLSGRKEATMESFVLIGQLGKWMEKAEDGTVTASSLTGESILEDAMMIIRKVSDLVINRNVMIECKPIDKVKQFYESFGFSDLQYDEETSLYSLYLIMEHDIPFDIPV